MKARQPLDLRQPAIGEPAPELLRSAYAVIDDGGVDLRATDLIGIARQPNRTSLIRSTATRCSSVIESRNASCHAVTFS
jgi:hypothetical protein